MFLTRIRVNQTEALSMALSDAYAWHQQLWKAFPGRDGQAREFLSHTDEHYDFFETLMLSQTAPASQEWGMWETRLVAPGYLRHERYLFSLRVNPTVKRVVRDSENGMRKQNGCRTRICDPGELRTWLDRKAMAAGFSVECAHHLRVSPPVDQISWRKKRRITHTRVDYDGILTVTDRDRFGEAYRKGIGPAKAFGFGLLLLKALGGESGGRAQ